MLGLKIELENKLSLGRAIVLVIFGFSLFGVSFYLTDPFGIYLYWLAIATFTSGIIVVFKKIWYRNKIKTILNASNEMYVKKVVLSNGIERRDWLKTHSNEVKKISDYASPDKYLTEQTIDYFICKGWKKEAIIDALVWNLCKEYYILGTLKGANKEEIFRTIKQQRPSWNNDYLQVLGEEVKSDYP